MAARPGRPGWAERIIQPIGRKIGPGRTGECRRRRRPAGRRTIPRGVRAMAAETVAVKQVAVKQAAVEQAVVKPWSNSELPKQWSNGGQELVRSCCKMAAPGMRLCSQIAVEKRSSGGRAAARTSATV